MATNVNPVDPMAFEQVQQPYGPQSERNVNAPQATDDPAEVERKVIINTMEGLRRMRYFRRQYDPRWTYYYRQYLGQRDQRFYPDNLTPRSNTFVPYAHANVETVIARTMDAFFSIDPPFETRGRGPESEAAAPNMQLVLQTGLHRANWLNALEVHLRNICIYGFAAIKVDWDWDYDTVTAPDPIFAMQPQIDPMTGQPILNPDGQPSIMPVINPMTGQPIQLGTQLVPKQIARMRPKLSPIDVYDTLIDPDGRQVAHLQEKTFAQMRRENEAHPELYLQGAIDKLATKLKNANEKNPDAVLIRIAEYWDETNNTVTLITYGEDAEALAWKDLRYSYRNANYSSYKRKVYQGSPILLQHGPNPFMHKRAPILCTSYTKLTGEPYGIGVIEKISDLNEAMNKFCNMITDNWNMGINHRYVYDTNADIDHNALNNFNVPGGKVGVNGNPNDIILPLQAFTPPAQDYQILSMYKELIQLVSGMSDYFNRGVGTPRGNATATGIGQVITESNFTFKQFIRNYETDILQPMLEMCASNIQQYVGDYAEYEITSAAPNIPKAGRIPIEKIIGNYCFDFVAANYATNKVVRQRNMMAFYQLAMQSPYAVQGEFLREIGKMMEIPNINRLIKPDSQVMQEQQQAMQLQAQQMLYEKILDTESKAIVAEVSKKKEDDPSTVAHGIEMQEELEGMLVAAGELPAGGPPTSGKKEGRPATRQHEGNIPGQGDTGPTRSLAQSLGANAMGLGQMGS